MRDTGIVLQEKLFTGSVTPPDAFDDASRFGNHGTHTAITWVRNPSGLWVRSFNGTTSVATMASSPSLTITILNGPVSIEAWINKTNIAVTGAVIHQGGVGARRLVSDILGSVARFGVATAGGMGVGDLVSGTTILVSGTWFYVVGTYDVVNLKIYLNGVLDGTKAKNTLPGSSSQPTYIGATTGGSAWWAGYLSNLRIYSYALNAAQIRARFEASRHWYGV